MYAVENSEKWRLYWGNKPVPSGCEALGLIWVGDGTRIENGVLFQNDSGKFFFGNDGMLKSLPTREVAKALNNALPLPRE